MAFITSFTWNLIPGYHEHVPDVTYLFQSSLTRLQIRRTIPRSLRPVLSVCDQCPFALLD